ncbi:unnamed protein product [Heligmosomoides polygyrus]|uniref:Uncharacterized protein n=1 Tax=Heligmosomoides polygyrus TaxID=6339 RepID=A0A183F357_HELPZ|nr:unnamed protein product [Heligmosomoides polygyrus]
MSLVTNQPQIGAPDDLLLSPRNLLAVETFCFYATRPYIIAESPPPYVLDPGLVLVKNRSRPGGEERRQPAKEDQIQTTAVTRITLVALRTASSPRPPISPTPDVIVIVHRSTSSFLHRMDDDTSDRIDRRRNRRPPPCPRAILRRHVAPRISPLPLILDPFLFSAPLCVHADFATLRAADFT